METIMLNGATNGMFLLNTNSDMNTTNNSMIIEYQVSMIESIIESIVEPIIFKC